MSTRTTQDLRAILFDAIEKVRNGTMERAVAREIGVLADRIIQTAEIELRYSLTVSRLDKDGQSISPGPLLLTDEGATRA